MDGLDAFWHDTLSKFSVFYPLISFSKKYIAKFLASKNMVAKRVESDFWPENIQRLCEEDADLSGLDAAVIVPRDGLFYGEIQG